MAEKRLIHRFNPEILADLKPSKLHPEIILKPSESHPKASQNIQKWSRNHHKHQKVVPRSSSNHPDGRKRLIHRFNPEILADLKPSKLHPEIILKPSESHPKASQNIQKWSRNHHKHQKVVPRSSSNHPDGRKRLIHRFNPEILADLKPSKLHPKIILKPS